MEDRLLWFGLVWLQSGDESFELELDVEVSAERKPQCIGRAGEECSSYF